MFLINRQLEGEPKMPKVEVHTKVEAYVDMNDNGDLDVLVYLGDNDAILEKVIPFESLMEEFLDHQVFEYGLKTYGKGLFDEEEWKTFHEARGEVLDRLRGLIDKYDKRKKN
jgi:hypothetical protein